MASGDDDYVQIRLAEIQRIRDVLWRLPERHTQQILRHLCEQVAALYQNLSKQLAERNAASATVTNP